MESALASMQELFPKVDVRILRGALLSHDRDVDEAAEWICTEVVPEMDGDSEADSEASLSDHAVLRDTSGDGILHSHDKDIDTDITNSYMEDIIPPIVFTSDTEMPGGDNSVVAHMIDAPTFELEDRNEDTGIDGDILNGGLEVTQGRQEGELDAKVAEMVDDDQQPQPQPLETPVSSVIAEAISNLLVSSGPLSISPEVTPLDVTGDQDVDPVTPVSPVSPVSRGSGVPGHDMDTVGETGSQYWDVKDALPVNSEEMSGTIARGKLVEGAVKLEVPTSEILSEAIVEVGVVETVVDSEETAIASAQEPSLMGLSSWERELEPAHCHGSSSMASLCESLTSNSQSRFMRVEDLEQLVDAAAENKEDLKGSILEVKMLVGIICSKEVEAEAAHKDAENGGKDTMLEAEQLRQDLHRAREGLETRAGEVYGERAVLAMEARELLARVRHVKDAREAARLALDELKRELQHRLEIACKKLESAVSEKKAKEEHARMLLAREQEEMANIGKQSEALDVEAESCTKLREFLIAKGKLLDSLQGELAVRCEDVETLKLRLTVPMTKSHVDESFGTSSTDNSLAEPLATFLYMQEALDQLELEKFKTGTLETGTGIETVNSGHTSGGNTPFGSAKLGSSTSSSVHKEDGEQKDCAARMAVLGGSMPSFSYGSQDLNMFSSFGEGEDDAGWEMVRNISDQMGTEAERSQDSPLSLSVESEKGSVENEEGSQL